MSPLSSPETVWVSPDRLLSGHWCHQRSKTLDEGDISAAYSGDLIAMEGRVRRPFRLQGWMCVTTSTCSHPARGATAYRLVPLPLFDGTPTTYRDKISSNGGDDARSDPQGFYHGMLVKHGGNEYVIAGPPMSIIAGEPEPTQSELF